MSWLTTGKSSPTPRSLNGGIFSSIGDTTRNGVTVQSTSTRVKLTLDDLSNVDIPPVDILERPPGRGYNADLMMKAPDACSRRAAGSVRVIHWHFFDDPHHVRGQPGVTRIR